ncbi:MAG TPA: alpha/beta hydrolase [Acidimicrobiales bacterium]|nr:alpha/beta hydrolase [Acidimicrobiales bacterium]
MDVLRRNNVKVVGNPAGRSIIFAHGFGCDQNMWRFVAPAFEDRYQTVLFDYVGAGGSDPAAYDPARYGTLDGYARDVLDICEALDVDEAVVVGHSVSAMIGVLAAAAAPERFGALVLIGPSPRYTDDDDGYVGGFSDEDIEGLLASLDSNYLGWSATMAPVIMGNSDRPALGAELTSSFCRADPDIQRRFARATFLADNRKDLERVTVPTLVLQCTDDVLAPDSVGAYVHQHLLRSRFVKLRATGHCPNLSAPQETVDAITAFLDSELRTGPSWP